MKNSVHTIASVSFLIWLIGFFGYQLNGTFHIFLLVALAAAIGRFLLQEVPAKGRKVNGRALERSNPGL